MAVVPRRIEFALRTRSQRMYRMYILWRACGCFLCAPSICAVYFQKTYHSRRGVTHYRLFFLLHFYNNTAILKAMKRRATGLTMQLISPKSSFPLQDGKHSRQIEQMPQNNKIAASTNKLSVSLLKIGCCVEPRTSLSALKVLGAYETDCAANFQKVLDKAEFAHIISTLDTRHSTLDTRLV